MKLISWDTWEGELENPQSLNRYSYVLNNPLKYTDPSGNFIDTVWDLANTLYDAGKIIGSASAYAVGSFTGNDLVKEFALEGLKQSLTDASVDVGAALIPGLPAGGSKVGRRLEKYGDEAVDVVKSTRNKVNEIFSTLKQSKVERFKTTEYLGKYKKITEIKPGKEAGQSRAEYIRYKNTETGRTVNSYKDSYSKGNKFEGRDPTRGGPSGRPKDDHSGNKSSFRKK